MDRAVDVENSKMNKRKQFLHCHLPMNSFLHYVIIMSHPVIKIHLPEIDLYSYLNVLGEFLRSTLSVKMNFGMIGRCVNQKELIEEN